MELEPERGRGRRLVATHEFEKRRREECEKTRVGDEAKEEQKRKKRKKKRRRRRRRSCRTVQENHLTQESETSGACIQENGRVGSGFRLSVTIATSVALWLSKRATGGKSLVRTIILHCCGLPFCNPTLHPILTPSIVALPFVDSSSSCWNTDFFPPFSSQWMCEDELEIPKSYQKEPIISSLITYPEFSTTNSAEYPQPQIIVKSRSHHDLTFPIHRPFWFTKQFGQSLPLSLFLSLVGTCPSFEMGKASALTRVIRVDNLIHPGEAEGMS